MGVGLDIREREFFLARLREAEGRVAAALTPGEREMWEQIVNEYRKQLEEPARTADG